MRRLSGLPFWQCADWRDCRSPGAAGDGVYLAHAVLFDSATPESAVGIPLFGVFRSAWRFVPAAGVAAVYFLRPDYWGLIVGNLALLAQGKLRFYVPHPERSLQKENL
jgi:hypothetical protein